MNVELKRIAEKKLEQLGGDVCGVLVRKDGRLAAVDEHGRVQWLQDGQGAELVSPGDPLPCPFCGSNDVGGASGTVGCYRCPAEIAVQNANTAYAVELWNNRVANHPQPAQQGGVPEPFAYHCIRGGKDCFSRSLREGDAALWQMSGAAITPLFKNATPQPEGDGWVKCRERLPTHSNPVQAITNDYPALGVAVVPARYVDGNGWTDIDNTDRDGDESPLSEVVAWREMCEIPTGFKRPQPPIEQEEK